MRLTGEQQRWPADMFPVSKEHIMQQLIEAMEESYREVEQEKANCQNPVCKAVRAEVRENGGNP